MSDWLSGIIGQGIAANLGATGHMAQQNAAQATQYGLSGCHNAAQQQAMANQQAYQAYQAQQQYHPQRVPRWMIDGRPVSITQFADEMFGEDTPEKTMFLLKYTKE